MATEYDVFLSQPGPMANVSAQLNASRWARSPISERTVLTVVSRTPCTGLDKGKTVPADASRPILREVKLGIDSLDTRDNVPRTVPCRKVNTVSNGNLCRMDHLHRP